MSDTSALKEIKKYVVGELTKDLRVPLYTKKVKIGDEGRQKQFSCVSAGEDIIATVLNHGGRTSGGNMPTAKIRSTYADCYFLSLTGAKRKIIVLTNPEFFQIFKEDSEGMLRDIELLYFKLPEELDNRVKKVIKGASQEMTK